MPQANDWIGGGWMVVVFVCSGGSCLRVGVVSCLDAREGVIFTAPEEPQ